MCCIADNSLFLGLDQPLLGNHIFSLFSLSCYVIITPMTTRHVNLNRNSVSMMLVWRASLSTQYSVTNNINHGSRGILSQNPARYDSSLSRTANAKLIQELRAVSHLPFPSRFILCLNPTRTRSHVSTHRYGLSGLPSCSKCPPRRSRLMKSTLP